MKFILIFILILLNCEVKNPLTQNGIFGFFTFYYNLSKIGNWNYTNPNPSYFVGGKINDNIPTSHSSDCKKFFYKGTLPEGTNFNSTNE